MDANKRELILKDEVYQIVGAAMEVSNELGNGFLEAVYQEAQILNYLKATGFPVGLLINFGTPKLEWKRYANTRNISGHSRPLAVDFS